MIFAQKAGKSSGLRLVARPWSTTTSRSIHSGPAFFRSVFSDGHEVTCLPRTASASISVHGSWQIAAIGLLGSKKRAHEADRARIGAQRVGVGDAAREHQRRIVLGLGLIQGPPDGYLVALFLLLHALDLAGMQRHDVDCGAFLAQRLYRLRQFRPLESIRRQYGDAEIFQLFGHLSSF